MTFTDGGMAPSFTDNSVAITLSLPEATLIDPVISELRVRVFQWFDMITFAFYHIVFAGLVGTLYWAILKYDLVAYV